MAMNKKVVDALLALGNINNVGERRVALLKVSEKHGRASIKPGYAGVRRLLNPQIKALESAHAKASQLGIGRQRTLGIREWGDVHEAQSG